MLGLLLIKYTVARRAVEIVCSEGPGRVLELAELGADFTRRADGQLSLHREGGHSHRRIVHAADVTGREIERALLEAASANSNIKFFEHHSALDLVMSEVRQPWLTCSAPCHQPLPYTLPAHNLAHGRHTLAGIEPLSSVQLMQAF